MIMSRVPAPTVDRGHRIVERNAELHPDSLYERLGSLLYDVCDCDYSQSGPLSAQAWRALVPFLDWWVENMCPRGYHAELWRLNFSGKEIAGLPQHWTEASCRCGTVLKAMHLDPPDEVR